MNGIMKREYCVTDGEGTLLDYGVAIGNDEIEDVFVWAYVKGFGFHTEPASDDCTTGE